MEERIKWFGKYMGCRVLIPGSFRAVLNAYNIIAIAHYKYRLILKDLKSITDEDLEGLTKVRSSEIGWDRETISNEESVIYLYWDEVDFLRSKGYAIGIPKEFYITEEEFNQMGGE